VASQFAATARGLLRGDAWLVKTLGDAVLIVTASPDDALDIAAELVAAIDAIDHYPSVSAGIHLGQVVEHDGDVFGRAVNLAARTAAHARPGQVLCTAALVERLHADRRTQLLPLGVVRFPNIPETVALHALRHGDEAAYAIDPVCRMKVGPDTAAATLRDDRGSHHFCSRGCLQTYLERPDVYPSPDSPSGSPNRSR
jgi:adenylate cyclase